MARPRVFADFHEADRLGRLRPNCAGAVGGLAEHGVQLRGGLALDLYSEGLEVEGLVCYSPEQGPWVAAIDGDAIRHQAAWPTPGPPRILG